MVPDVQNAKCTLSVPLYACCFDPLDSSTLIVGGGGGASKTGIGNKITLLQVSTSEEILVAAEIELSKDEDNPTSLAVGSSHLIYAGLNSSPKEIKEGRNLHFRIYGIQQEGIEDEKGIVKDSNRLKIIERLKCSLFSRTEKDTYQRLIRLATPFPNQPKLGAITTGLAKNHEIVLFEIDYHNPPKLQEILKIDKEAVDIDFFHSDSNEILFAYCDEYAVYFKKITSKREHLQPKCIYLVPALRSEKRFKEFSIRAIRWLTKNHIIMLINLFGNGGVSLQIIEVLSEGIQTQALKLTRLPRRHKKATGLCIADLSPAPNPGDGQINTQFVLAVASHNRSILLFTVDVKIEAGISILSEITHFRSFQNVHPLQITSLAFSTLTSPSMSAEMVLPQPILRLASVGISQTVVVHTLRIFPICSPIKHGEYKTNRYVVRLPQRTRIKTLVAFSIVGVLLMAIIIQVIFGIKSDDFGYFARDHISFRLQKALGTKPLDGTNQSILHNSGY